MATDIQQLSPPVWRYLFPFIRVNGEAFPPSPYVDKLQNGYIYSWEAMASPSFKTDSEALYFLFIAVRLFLFIIGVVFTAIDFDGETFHNPEKVVFTLICLYGGLSTILVPLKKKYATCFMFSNGVPLLAKFAWFCYDIWMPTALASFILYMHFGEKKQEMTKRVYGFNFAAMLFELIMSQMVILPAHMAFYSVVTIPASLAYAYEYNATIQQTIIGVALVQGCYIFMFALTYTRANFFQNHPVSYPIVPPSVSFPEEEKMVDKAAEPSAAAAAAAPQKISWFRKQQEV